MARNRMTLVLMSLVGALIVAPGAQAQEPIQPGSSITMGGSYCTLNWIYDGAGALDGEVFGGTAAHCVSEVGQEVQLATTSLGEPLGRIGEVAFIGNAEEPGRDYAFIEIDDAALDRVDPALKGHPNIPTGVSTGYQQGDLMQFSGHGVVFNLTTTTQEERVGILNYTDGVVHNVTGPVSSGDSGGPVADLSDGGTAFGIVNTLGVGANTGAQTIVVAGEGGANLDFVLQDAANHGFTVELRTV